MGCAGKSAWEIGAHSGVTRRAAGGISITPAATTSSTKHAIPCLAGLFFRFTVVGFNRLP
ncbi:hypothetical protein AJ88_37595 [Mesorhizobium amorphae CCBAU 01583]|nr:hypothetical protein AJ88_37595 [Mesorhizobium amorphae CCBAU 01583]